MKHTLWLLSVIMFAGCGGPEVPELPPISISNGGVSLMNDATTPEQAYENAYARLTGYHNKIRMANTSNPPNTYAACAYMKDIVASLETMEALLVEPYKSALHPYLAWYREGANSGRFGGSFESNLQRYQQEIRSRFSPSNVEVIKEFPKPAPDTPPPSPPVPKETKEPTSATEPPKPTPSQDIPLWMFFNAWKQSHSELLDLYAKKADCAKAYQRVREALAALKDRVPSEKQGKLVLADASYQQQHDETKGFTQPPKGGKEEDVLRVIRLIGEMVETEYNPDKK